MDTSQGRRRESAVLVRQVTTWRPDDLTNAFGSVDVGGDGSSRSESVGTELSSWAAETQAGDHYDSGQGWGCQRSKLEKRELMGDPLMVALFWVAFLPSTIRWQLGCGRRGAESGQLLAWHPWPGGRIDLSLSQYADDTTKQIVAEPGEDAQALAKRVRCSNDTF